MPRISYRRKLFLKKLLRTMLIVAGIVAVVSIVLLIYFEPFVTYDREGAHLDLSSKGGEAVASTAPGARPVINDAQIIMQEPEANGSSILELSGYYITTAMLQEPEKVRQALETLDSSCAVMIEMKSIYGGRGHCRSRRHSLLSALARLLHDRGDPCVLRHEFRAGKPVQRSAAGQRRTVDGRACVLLARSGQ